MKWFSNLKIGNKLIIGFVLVALLAGFVGGFGVVKLKTIDSMDSKLYNENVIGILQISNAQMDFMKNRVEARNLLLSAGKDKTQIYNNIQNNFDALDNALNQYDKTITDKEDRANFDKLTVLVGNFKNDMNIVMDAYKNGKSNTYITNSMNKSSNNINAVGDMLDVMGNWNEKQAYTRQIENTNAANSTIFIMSFIVIIAVIAAIVLGVFLARIISRPINMLAKASEKLADGDIDVNIEVNCKDEVGQLSEAFKKMADGIKNQVYLIERIAEGDMTANVQIRSEKDIMNKKLSELLEINNHVFGDIRCAADQVEAAAGQVSAGSQVLAQGATEQASTVEEVNASIEEISSQAKENAVNSRKTSELASNAKENAVAGTEKMKEMMQAMSEINEASDSISKIIKVIDEIAFQTNILALNAAVEAARAGAHGKGFAVVAEEVRNLAGRSAQAAKETTELIEGNIKKTENGTNIAKETKNALDEIVGIIAEVADTIDSISNASTEQASAISQVSMAISQIADTTQTNSSTAEESASASEELSSQALLLKDSIARFKLKDENLYYKNRKNIELETDGRESMKNKVECGNKMITNGGLFGKY